MTNESKALTPTEEKIVVFYEDQLMAAKLESGDIYVPVRRLCDNLGLDWASQWRRIQRDEVLSDAVKSVVVMTTDLDRSKRGPRKSEMNCLPLDLIPGWLFGIQTGRVREDIRPKLIRYRRECFRVLWDAFRHDILPAMDPALSPPAEDLTPAERALVLAEAVTAMARQQVTMERWLAHHDGRLDAVEDGMTNAHVRIDALELTIAGGPTVTTAQAAAVSKAVKALAYKLGQVEPEKGNPYPRVYSRLYRTFSVSSYKAIPLETFPAVMTWLADWWGDIADEPPPFGAHDVGGQLGLGLDTADPAGE